MNDESKIIENLNFFGDALKKLIEEFNILKDSVSELTNENARLRNILESNKNEYNSLNSTEKEINKTTDNDQTTKDQTNCPQETEHVEIEKFEEIDNKTTENDIPEIQPEKIDRRNLGNNFYTIQKNSFSDNSKFSFPNIIRNQNTGISIAKICTFGDIFISEIDTSGRFIRITNSSRTRTIDIGKYTVQEVVDGSLAYLFTIPPLLKLNPLKSMCIWANGHDRIGENDCIYHEIERWIACVDSVFIICRMDGKALSWAVGPECNIKRKTESAQSVKLGKRLDKMAFNRPQSGIIRLRIDQNR